MSTLIVRPALKLRFAFFLFCQRQTQSSPQSPAATSLTRSIYEEKKNVIFHLSQKLDMYPQPANTTVSPHTRNPKIVVIVPPVSTSFWAGRTILVLLTLVRVCVSYGTNPPRYGLLSLTTCEKAGPRTMESRDSPEASSRPRCRAWRSRPAYPITSCASGPCSRPLRSAHTTLPPNDLLTLLPVAPSLARHPQALGDGPEGDVHDVLGCFRLAAPSIRCSIGHFVAGSPLITDTGLAYHQTASRTTLPG